MWLVRRVFPEPGIPVSRRQPFFVSSLFTSLENKFFKFLLIYEFIYFFSFFRSMSYALRNVFAIEKLCDVFESVWFYYIINWKAANLRVCSGNIRKFLRRIQFLVNFSVCVLSLFQNIKLYWICGFIIKFLPLNVSFMFISKSSLSLS